MANESSVTEPDLDYGLRSPCRNLVVLDKGLKVLAAEQGTDTLLDGKLQIGGACTETLRKAVEGLAARPPDERRSVINTGPSLLHLVGLNGTDGPYYAVFVEHQIEAEQLESSAKRYGLTKRETEVLELIINGKSGSEIAQTLCIRLATVNDHFKSLRRKTDTHSRSAMLVKILGKRRKSIDVVVGETSADARDLVHR